MGDEGGEAIEDRAGLLEIGDGAQCGDGLGQGDFTAAGAGQGAFAHERVVTVGGEEFGDGLVGVRQVRSGKTNRQVREYEDLLLVFDGAEFGQHLGRGDADRGRTDLGVGVLEGETDVFRAGGREAVKGPERLQAGGGGGLGVGEQRAERGSGSDVGRLDQQALGRIAHPTVGVGEELHSVHDGGRNFRRLGRSLVVADNAPDAALVDRGLQLARLDVGDQVVCEEARVLQHSTVEIDDVEGAIWSGGGHDGAEAFVGRRQKLFFFVSVGAGEQAVLFGDDHALHQV